MTRVGTASMTNKLTARACRHCKSTPTGDISELTCATLQCGRWRHAPGVATHLSGAYSQNHRRRRRKCTAIAAIGPVRRVQLFAVSCRASALLGLAMLCTHLTAWAVPSPPHDPAALLTRARWHPSPLYWRLQSRSRWILEHMSRGLFMLRQTM
jgi:hypothetical protein